MIRSVESGNEALSVTWQSGGRSGFPNIGLRDNCHCAKCRDPRNGQRLFDALDLPAEPKPLEATLEHGAVVVRWAGEDHESRYPAGWLEAHDLSVDARAKRRVAHR